MMEPSAVSSSTATGIASWAPRHSYASCLDPQQVVSKSVPYPSKKRTKKRNTWRFCHNCGMYSHLREDCLNASDPILVWQRLKKRDERRIKRQNRQTAKRATQAVESQRSDSEDSGCSSSYNSVSETEVNLYHDESMLDLSSSVNESPDLQGAQISMLNAPTANTLIREIGAVDAQADMTETKIEGNLQRVEGHKTSPDTLDLLDPEDLRTAPKDAVEVVFKDAGSGSDVPDVPRLKHPAPMDRRPCQPHQSRLSSRRFQFCLVRNLAGNSGGSAATRCHPTGKTRSRCSRTKPASSPVPDN